MMLAIGILAAFVAGVVLFVRGVRGRAVDDHPLCRRCRYDLSGTPERPEKCPECGTDLARRQAIRIGHRRKRWVSLVMGLLLTLGGAGAGTHYGLPWARNFDFNPYKPLWMLRREAVGTDQQRAKAAQQEIVARCGDGRISSAQAAILTDESLRVQADPSLKWTPWRGDVVESLWQRGQVPADRMMRYAQTAVNDAVFIKAPKRVRQGGMCMVLVGHDAARVGGRRGLLVELKDCKTLIDDKPMMDRDSRSGTFGLSPNGSGSGGSGWQADAAPGEHVIALQGECVVSLAPLRARQSAAPSPDEQAREAAPPGLIGSWALSKRTPLTIVGPGETMVKAKPDESLRDAIRRSIVVDQLISVGGGGSLGLTSAQVRIEKPPTDVAFDVFWRSGGREELIRSEIQRAGEARRTPGVGIRMNPGRMSRPVGIPDGIDKVDLVFRSSVSAAEDFGDVDAIWEGEIVIPDVPVQRSGSGRQRPRPSGSSRIPSSQPAPGGNGN